MENQPHEFTIGGLIKSANKTLKDLWSHKVFIIVSCIVFSGLLVLKTYYEKPIYNSSLTFSMADDAGGGVGAIGSILGQFGISGSRKTNFEKMVEFCRTSKIQSQVIFSILEINGKEDYLGNHIITLYDFDDNWRKKKSKLLGMRLTNSNIDSFDYYQHAIYKQIYTKIIGSGPTKAEGLLYADYDLLSEIVTLSARTINENLSIVLVEKSFEFLSKYYVTTTIIKHQNTFNILKEKADSINLALSNIDINIANFNDRNLGLRSFSSRVGKNAYEREKSKLTIMLGELTKNLEIADFALKSNTPIISLIDKPLLPIYPNKTSLITAGIIGGFLGGIIAIILVLIRKVYLDNR